MRRQFIAVISLFVSCFCTAAESTVPKEGDEPAPEHGKLNTADASPIDPLHFELEVTYAYTDSVRAFNNRGHREKCGCAHDQVTTVSLTIGAIQNLDVNANFGYIWNHDSENDVDSSDGISGPFYGRNITDTGVGMRYRFLNIEKYLLEVAYLSGLTIPTGKRPTKRQLGTSQEFWSWDQAVAVSKDWGKFTTNAEAGFSLPFGGRRNDARGTFTANIAAGYQILKWLQPEAELNYNYTFANSSGANVLAATAGLVMPISGHWRVNAGVQQALIGRNNKDSTTFQLAVKVAW